MISALLLCTLAYTSLTLEGWPVKAETSVIQTAEWTAARRELENQLYRVSRVVPDPVLTKLKKVTIWVHRESTITACMAYHPSGVWLKEHGANPEMEKGIEIGSLKNFSNWTHHQPWMVLHELAHAYHFQIMEKGFENPLIKSVYQKAMEGKRYEQVLRWDGTQQKHYACNNQMEYFAEATEAYFGRNDFYPFVNAELKTFDPDTFDLMEKCWGKLPKRG